MEDKIDIGALKERLNRDIDDMDAALSLANAYYDVNDAPSAILYYRRVLDINPDMPNVLTDMGAMYWRNDDIGLAEKAFRDAIAVDSVFGAAYLNLGFLLRDAKGNLTEARAIWNQFLEVNPQHELAGKAKDLLRETSLSVN